MSCSCSCAPAACAAHVFFRLARMRRKTRWPLFLWHTPTKCSDTGLLARLALMLNARLIDPLAYLVRHLLLVFGSRMQNSSPPVRATCLHAAAVLSTLDISTSSLSLPGAEAVIDEPQPVDVAHDHRQRICARCRRFTSLEENLCKARQHVMEIEVRDFLLPFNLSLCLATPSQPAAVCILPSLVAKNSHTSPRILDGDAHIASFFLPSCQILRNALFAALLSCRTLFFVQASMVGMSACV